MSNIHSETYRIRNYEADPNGKLRLASLANYLQDAADRHAIALGAGVPHLLTQGLSWVLYRMRINIHEWPRIPEEMTITTNPSGEERVYVYRDYHVHNFEKKLLASASSTWLVFDLNKRKMTSPTADLKRLFEPYHQLPHLPRANQKYPSPPISWQYQMQVTARQNEIDQNDHVNNGVYFQWLLEPLPTDYLKVRQCTMLDITFKAESVRGETIRSLCQPVSDNTLIHRLENEQADEIVTAISHWDWI